MNVISKKRAYLISNGIFLISLGILIATDAWWPWILVAIWATLASRQYLSGRYYYAAFSSLIFLGFFVFSLFRLDYAILAPVIPIVLGVFIMLRGYLSKEKQTECNTSVEILDDTHPDKS